MPPLTLPAAVRPPVWRAKAMVFEDPRSHALLTRIERVAPSEATVLVVGETGTGKELVARHIHELSRRASGPFLAVNCGAFAESLVENDLFGHAKGAFTGALDEKAGWFEAASGGTLFLDEIGNLPLALQVKLLRVLQEREVVRLGSHKPIPVDVRVVAATNMNVEEAVTAGRFRADLYYRLAVAKVAIAPLRERLGDILPLARHFLALHANALGLDEVDRDTRPTLTPEAEARLVAHRWPGNIRELENAIHHALLICEGGRITPDDLPPVDAPTRVTAAPPPEPATLVAPEPRATLRSALRALYLENPPRLWDELEETIVRTAYDHTENNQLKTARLLGLSRSVVRARLVEFGALARAEPDADRTDTPAPATERTSTWADRNNIHVLVIEDDDTVRSSLVELLEQSGYDVSPAENGRVALELLSTSPAPDLIVLDLKMPVMDGWQFRAIQQGDPKLGPIPVVAITADRGAPPTTISAEAYLRKPLDAGEFLRTVERTQRRARSLPQ